MSIEINYAGSPAIESQGALYELNYADGSGGWVSSPTIVTDASGNLITSGNLYLSSNATTGLMYFGSDASSWVYKTGNLMQFKVNNSNIVTLSTTYVGIKDTGLLNWSSTSSAHGTPDTGLKRDSAGVLKVTDGSTGVGGLIYNTLTPVTTVRIAYTDNQMFLGKSMSLNWITSATASTSGIPDTGLERDSAGVLKVTDGSTGSGELLYRKPLINISALHTAVVTNQVINCTANSFTVTLPTAVGITGKSFTIKNSGTGVITIDADGTETIDGSLTQSLNQYHSRTVISDGTNWIII